MKSRRRKANVVLLSLLALPCLLMFQADESMWMLNLLGAAYTWFLWNNIGKKLKEPEDKDSAFDVDS